MRSFTAVWTSELLHYVFIPVLFFHLFIFMRLFIVHKEINRLTTFQEPVNVRCDDSDREVLTLNDKLLLCVCEIGIYKKKET